MLTRTPMEDVMSMEVLSISKSRVMTLCTARYTRMPVTTQIISTDVRAPITSALYHPKLMVRVGGRDATHKENKEIMKLAKSVRRCAASVAIARLEDNTPPVQGEHTFS